MVVRAVLSFLVMNLLTAAPALAQAQEETKTSKPLFSFKTDDREPIFGNRFTLKAGYKVWVAKWQAPVILNAPSGAVVATADHPSVMNGPSVSAILRVRNSEWFNSIVVNVISLRDGFDFQEVGTFGNRNQHFANRRDTVVTGGIAIWEGIGVFGGYYTSGQDFTYTSLQGFSPAFQRRSLLGPIMGIFGSGQVSERVSMYGNVAFAMLKLKSELGQGFAPSTRIATDSAQGYATEFGFNIIGPRLWNIGTEFQAGFRAQIINKTFGNDPSANRPGGTIVNDLTYGPVFAINAVF